MKNPSSESPRTVSFLDHWEELRSRLIKSLLAVGLTAFLFYFFLDPVLAFLIRPVGRVVFTSPTEAFVARMTLTLFGGFFLALPVVLYQFWQFVGAGLKTAERKLIVIFGPVSLILFVLGALFAFFVMIPISLQFLLGFSSDIIHPMITVNNYISFVGMMLLAFGIIFELPLVLAFLAKIGIATEEFLRQKRRHAIVLILIVSALITPPDVVTQLIMAVPLIVLYEIGVIVVRLMKKGQTPTW